MNALRNWIEGERAKNLSDDVLMQAAIEAGWEKSAVTTVMQSSQQTPTDSQKNHEVFQRSKAFKALYLAIFLQAVPLLLLVILDATGTYSQEDTFIPLWFAMFFFLLLYLGVQLVTLLFLRLRLLVGLLILGLAFLYTALISISFVPVLFFNIPNSGDEPTLWFYLTGVAYQIIVLYAFYAAIQKYFAWRTLFVKKVTAHRVAEKQKLHRGLREQFLELYAAHPVAVYMFLVCIGLALVEFTLTWQAINYTESVVRNTLYVAIAIFLGLHLISLITLFYKKWITIVMYVLSVGAQFPALYQTSEGTSIQNDTSFVWMVCVLVEVIILLYAFYLMHHQRRLTTNTT